MFTVHNIARFYCFSHSTNISFRVYSQVPTTGPIKPLKVSKRPISNVDKIVAVASGKGGVGKSTVAVNLAHCLSRSGKRVGILDADVFGPSIPRMMNISGKSATSEDGLLLPLLNYGIQCMSIAFLTSTEGPVVWRGMMVTSALQTLMHKVKWNPIDILVIDMPPGTGDTQITITQQLLLSGAIIVTTPQNAALSIAKKGTEMFRKVDVPILGIALNMSSYICSSCGHREEIFGSESATSNDINRKLNAQVLCSIPLCTEICEKADKGLSILSSTTNVSIREQYESLTDRILAKIY